MRLSSRGQSLEGQIFYICVNDVIIFVLVTFVFFVPSLAFSWLHLFSSSGSLVLSSQLSSVQVHFLHLLCLRAFLTSQTCLPPPSSPPPKPNNIHCKYCTGCCQCATLHQRQVSAGLKLSGRWQCCPYHWPELSKHQNRATIRFGGQTTGSMISTRAISGRGSFSKDNEVHRS